jgi:undecaprenyl-diphosphatase
MTFLQPILALDRSVFLFLNGLHAGFLDPVMFWATKPVVWLPLFLVLLYFTIRTFRWKTLAIILSVVAVVTVSDQMANLSKDQFKRFRPSQDPGLEAAVHTVNGYRGGLYGFYSGHGSSTMAVAVFLIFLFRGRYRWLAPVILSWAVIMGYTRIYLGVHYPGDVLAGMLMGVLIGRTGAAGCYALFRLQETPRSRS